MRFSYIYSFIPVIILLVSCKQKVSDNEQERSSSWSNLLHTITETVSSSPSQLSPQEYVDWVKKQKGITYTTVSNEQFELNLLFHPPQLEAYSSAVANGADPKKEFVNYLKIQQGYYYCTAECTVRAESASDPVKKTDLLNLLKQQLTVVKNNNDTLRSIITEAFPSHVMNQPNKLLILIPQSDSLSNYKININASFLHLNECQLNLTSEDLQSFPLIKL